MGFYQCCIQAFIVATVLLSVGVTLWGGYYLLVGVASCRPAHTYPVSAPKHRFAVLIAARNEELVIGALVKSLLDQRYPGHLYDVYVIPNNCTDGTEQAAREAGARIMDCTIPVRSKGEVLRFAVDRLMDQGYDAFCVFDADNIVDENFLAEMNNALCAGVRAAQGYRDSKNPYDTAISSCYSIYYWMMNRFYNQGKTNCGVSAMVNRTGFMISAQVLRELGGWNTRTISEDLEITVQCALKQVQVAWVPRAVTYDEQPLTFRESIKQRRRWSSGTIQVAETYTGSVLGQLRGGVRGTAVDMLATLTVPAYQAIAALSALLGAVAAGFGEIPYQFTLAGFAAALGLNLLVTAAAATAGAVLVCIMEGQMDRRLWKGLAFYNVFLLSWVPITFLCFFRRTTQWEQIRHTRVMTRVPARKVLQKSQIA